MWDAPAYSQPITVQAEVYQSAPFGSEIGNSYGVIAYSNESTFYISHEPSEGSGIFSGMKWQCVEYARRFMQKRLGLTFQGVNAAQNIWDLEKASLLESGSFVPFYAVPNGTSETLPSIGALVIYPISANSPFGHVAVVVNVDRGLVYLAEQNWDNRTWLGDRSYSRTLRLEMNSKGFWELIDDSGFEILGWKTTQNPSQ